MFREMRRFKQALTAEECKEVLKTSKRGVLSVHGDDGYPYGIPVNHFYDEEKGKIYFHCAVTGHKTDAIKRNDKVSFVTTNGGEKREDEWFLRFQSVVVFGRAKLVEDEKEIEKICSALCGKFGQGKEYEESEWKKYGKNVSCVEITIEHMTGKNVKES